jgi:Secretion system C-terminal sorting domain/Putative metal-binding motif
MGKINGCILIVLFAHTVIAQSLSLEWVTTINTNKSAITGTDIRDGNRLLIKGFYQDYLCVNNDTLINESDVRQDTYLLELSEEGQGNWARRFELTTGEVYNEISSHGNNIYNHGWLISWPSTPGKIEFQKVPLHNMDTVFTLIGSDSDFDNLGNLYTTGSFQNMYDFDPSSNSKKLTSLYGSDSFVAKYDSNRSLIWARSFPGLGFESGRTLAVDQDNNVIIVANLTDSVDIDLSKPGFELPNGDGQENSFFMVKLSADGSLIWYKAFRSSVKMQINDITVDSKNSIIATGSFTGTLDYDLSGTDFSLISKGKEDAFVAKLNSQGEFEWVNQIACTNDVYGIKVEVDHNNYIFHLGSYYDSLMVDSSIDSFYVSQGFSDSYLRIYNEFGDQLNSYTFGGIGFDWARSMHIDKSSNLYLISGAGSNFDVDLEAGEFLIQTSGTSPSFVAKYKVCFPEQPEVPYNGIDDDCNPTTLDDDIDQDGFLLIDDCDDTIANINPNQTEEPYNGIDDDCNSTTLDDDLDRDGFLLVDDCDDSNPNINPGAEEIASNGIDEDCDGMDMTTGVHELAESTIRIYPNPVSNLLHIEVQGQLDFKVSLFDLNGKQVYTARNQTIIPVNTLVQGTYLLELQEQQTGKKIVEKIIVGK